MGRAWLVAATLAHTEVQCREKSRIHCDLEKNLYTDVIISRAFKPLPIIFQIAQNNFKSFKYIIIFLGKSGKKILKDALKIWKFDYEEKQSLTSNESMIVKISNLRKKNGNKK